MLIREKKRVYRRLETVLQMNVNPLVFFRAKFVLRFTPLEVVPKDVADLWPERFPEPSSPIT